VAGDEQDQQQPTGYRPGARYSTLVGVAFLVIVAIATLNTVQTEEGGILGAGDERGTPLAGFAVPELLGSLEGDANVFQDDCETARSPCPEGDRRTPACEVELADVIRICDFFDRPLALSFWFTRGADCLPTQDTFDDLARRYRGRVNFVSINVRDDREEARRIVTERDWDVPVGYDADGAVSNLYRIGVCPTVAFAYPGGILRGARIGSEELTPEAMEADIRRLIDESGQRAATDR
jgi:thiol-disulfide isomerase/thioredoxin